MFVILIYILFKNQFFYILFKNYFTLLHDIHKLYSLTSNILFVIQYIIINKISLIM